MSETAQTFQSVGYMAYLVTNGKDGEAKRFLDMRDGLFELVACPRTALHFFRKDDAEKFLEPGWEIERHMFTSGLVPLASAGEEGSPK